MTDTISENDKLEYQEAMKLYALDSGLRRQGLTFIATAQAVLIAVVFKYTIDNPMLVIALATFAIFIALLGLNNDYRLSRYMGAYETRMLEIENKNQLSLVKLIVDVQKTRSPLLSNEAVFIVFFVLLAMGWAAVIIWQISTL